MDIKIGQVGQITAGDDVGKYVKVVEDLESTGGYLILTAGEADMCDGFNSWVENRAALVQYFAESGWSIDWDV